jgi:hypothetical protein
MEDLVTDERDYMISGPGAVDELMAAVKFRELRLDELLTNARELDCD